MQVTVDWTTVVVIEGVSVGEEMVAGAVTLGDDESDRIGVETEEETRVEGRLDKESEEESVPLAELTYPAGVLLDSTALVAT